MIHVTRVRRHGLIGPRQLRARGGAGLQDRAGAAVPGLDNVDADGCGLGDRAVHNAETPLSPEARTVLVE